MTPRTPLFRPLLTGLAIAASLVLAAGCDSYREDWSNLPEQKEPKVNLVRYAHAVHFVPGSIRLDGGERTLLDAFLAKVQAGPVDAVVVVGPAGDALAARRRETVMAYLTLRAVQPRAGSAGVDAESGGPDTVAIIVRRHSVTLPACPDWSDTPGRTWNNTVSRNWGCATAINLGLMVNDPADLAAGHAPGPMDGEAAVLAIKRYRAGETKALTPEDVGTIESQQKTGGSSSGGGQ